jgi:hypothetical protein
MGRERHLHVLPRMGRELVPRIPDKVLDRHNRERSAAAGAVPQVGIEPTTYRLEGEFSRGPAKILVVITVLTCLRNVAR